MSAARPWRDGDAPVPLNIDLSIAGLRVRGCLRGLSPRGLLHVGYSRVKANEELRLWIRHLVLNAVSRTGYPKQSTLIGRPEKGEGVALLTFRPVDDPAAHLTRLGQLYRYGQSAPLVFLPEVSRIFAATLAAKEEQNDPRGEAILKARNAFNETVHSRWGVEDPYLIRAWGEEAPFERACAFAARQGFPFDQAAVEVFEPLFEHEERDR
jgi:exonuclease V gamma subunit